MREAGPLISPNFLPPCPLVSHSRYPQRFSSLLSWQSCSGAGRVEKAGPHEALTVGAGSVSSADNSQYGKTKETIEVEPIVQPVSHRKELFQQRFPACS